MQTLLTPTKTVVTPTTDSRKLLSRKLARLEAGLSRTDDTISATPIEPSLLKQCQEQLSDYKKDLTVQYDDLLAMDVADEDELLVLHSKLEKLLFDASHKIKKSLTAAPAESGSTATDSTGVKLPKLDVPTFDGNIIHWKQFWEQFMVSLHDRSNLSNAKKIVYLQHAIKDGSARNTIEGLSHSGNNYDEAVECLKSRFDRPRLIHCTHVQMIVDAPPLKEGTGKELRRLHDTMQQHVRALKTLGCELPGKFITSNIELKLDVDTLFKWQKHSQANADVPHYQVLLNFINLRAQASETSCTTQTRKVSRNDQHIRKSQGKMVTSFVTSSNSTDGNCVVCETDKHPLYV